MLEGFGRDVSHQEIERILSEIEVWYETAHDQAGAEWLPLAGITNFLFNDLGYEDIDEFEDAVGGTFPDFVRAFPHIEVKKDGLDSEGADRWFIKVREIPPGPPRTLTLMVESSGQLLNTTFMKAPDALLQIPGLEFEIGADSKRRIDTLYNHIVTAKENLENHSQMLVEDPAQQTALMDTVRALTAALDVEKPFELVIRDHSGLSEFKPDTGVRTLGILYPAVEENSTAADECD